MHIVVFFRIPVWIYHTGKLLDDFFYRIADAFPQIFVTPIGLFAQLIYLMGNFYAQKGTGVTTVIIRWNVVRNLATPGYNVSNLFVVLF